MRILALIFLTVAAYASASDRNEFSTEGMTSLYVENPAGKVEISVAKGPSAVVVVDKKQFGPKCQIRMERENTALVVKVTKAMEISDESCEVNFDIQIPKKAFLDLKTGSADVNVKDISGDLEFRSGSGNLDVSAEIKKLTARTGSGDIKAKGIVGNSDVKSGSGDIQLHYASALPHAEVTLRSGSGNATLLVPPTTKLKTDFTSGSGKLTNEIGETMAAGFKVIMRTGSGNLQISSNK